MTANTAVKHVRRDPAGWLVKAAGASAIIAGLIGALCGAPVASAEPAPLTTADFAGRWVSINKTLTLDLAPCGNGWCGVVVTGEACGPTALRMSSKSENPRYQTAPEGEMFGQLKLAAKAEAYGVRVRVARDNKADKITLHIGGHAGAYAMIRRSYDYNDVFARIGDASCAPDPKTS